MIAAVTPSKDVNLKMKLPKTSLRTMLSFPNMEYLIRSIVIKILSFKQKTLLLNKKKNYKTRWILVSLELQNKDLL